MSFTLSQALDPSKVFLTSNRAMERRWDPNYYRCMSVFRDKVKDCPFPLRRLKPSLSLVQYGISERATEEPVGVPMLRMVNLQADAWDITELKYIKMKESEKKVYLLRNGDLLFNRTNSKELVGKCNVFNLPGEYVFASYLIRVRLKADTLLPDYVTAYLASPVGRIQIDAVSRQIAGMTNINAEEIRDLLIPIPKQETQQRVVGAWQKAIRQRDSTLESARNILADIDDMLLLELGIRPRPESPNTIESRMFRRALSEVSGERLDPVANQEKRRLLVAAIHSGRYPVSPLREIVGIQKKLVDAISSGDVYIGLENIDGGSGEFIPTAVKESVGTAVEFRKGQILFPKLRPYLNKTHLATFGGVCSTEFHVFTPVGLRGDYLTAFLRSRAIVDITSLLMTGNTLPRLQRTDIDRLPIPIPPKKDQERLAIQIEELKSKAATLRARAAENLAQAKGSIEALILRGRRSG